jgi:hypothetical protein
MLRTPHCRFSTPRSRGMPASARCCAGPSGPRRSARRKPGPLQQPWAASSAAWRSRGCSGSGPIPWPSPQLIANCGGPTPWCPHSSGSQGSMPAVAPAHWRGSFCLPPCSASPATRRAASGTASRQRPRPPGRSSTPTAIPSAARPARRSVPSRRPAGVNAVAVSAGRSLGPRLSGAGRASNTTIRPAARPRAPRRRPPRARCGSPGGWRASLSTSAIPLPGAVGSGVCAARRRCPCARSTASWPSSARSIRIGQARRPAPPGPPPPHPFHAPVAHEYGLMDGRRRDGAWQGHRWWSLSILDG